MQVVPILLSGYGKMGHEIEAELHSRGLEPLGWTEDVASVDPALAREAVCVDFTQPAAFRKNYPFIARHFKAAVVGTTGWDDLASEVCDCFRREGTCLIYGHNFSVGVNLFFKICAYAARCCAAFPGYEPYILEMHHNQKLDAPSGTAKTLQKCIAPAYPQVRVSDVRCGAIPGIHQLGFEGSRDRIQLKHEAFSRRGFAAGAVDAALWAQDLQGIHTFESLFEQKLQAKL